MFDPENCIIFPCRNFPYFLLNTCIKYKFRRKFEDWIQFSEEETVEICPKCDLNDTPISIQSHILQALGKNIKSQVKIYFVTGHSGSYWRMLPRIRWPTSALRIPNDTPYL